MPSADSLAIIMHSEPLYHINSDFRGSRQGLLMPLCQSKSQISYVKVSSININPLYTSGFFLLC